MSGRLASLLGFVVQCLYALAMGAVLGLVFFALPPNSPPLGFLILVIYFFTTSWLTTLVHELGHSLAFSLLDFRLLAIKIGPLLFRRSPRAWYWEWKNIRITGGFTLAAPRQNVRFGRRFIVAVLAGPLAGLAFASLLLEIYHLWDGAGPMAQAFLLGAAGVSLLGSLVSLVPLPVSSTADLAPHTDAELALRLAGGGPEARWLRSYFALLSATCSGQRPGLWQQNWLEDLTAAELSPVSLANGNWLMAQALLDRGDVEGAAAALNRCLALVSDQKAPATASLRALAAYIEARYGSGASAARPWIEGARMSELDEPATMLRAQAAISLAEGMPQKALEEVTKALEALQRSIELGFVEAESDLLEQMRQEAQTQLEHMHAGEPAVLSAPSRQVHITPLEKAGMSHTRRALAYTRRLAVGLLLFGGMLVVLYALLPPNCSARLWENFFCP
jgi:hypothetical protein